MILLPGFEKQLKFLLANSDIENKNILVIGEGSEEIAIKLAYESKNRIQLILQDFESFINAKALLSQNDIDVKMMEYEVTDFGDSTFDIIFAQASISLENRNKIYKEIKRILKPEGIISVGEITKTQKNLPPFMNSLLEEASLFPIYFDEIENYFTERKLEIIERKILPNALKEYYSKIRENLKDYKKSNETEDTSTKKLLKKISHETNSFVKHGADKFLGFELFLLKLKK